MIPVGLAHFAQPCHILNRVKPDSGKVDLRQIIKAYDVRGTTPHPFSPEVARAVGSAFAQVVVWPESGSAVPKVVIGQDMRESGDELVAAFSAGLTEASIDVELIGKCSTDGLYFAAASRQIPGAMFTASHNPAEYNGIKMCRSQAEPVGEASGLAEIRALAQELLDGQETPVHATARVGVVSRSEDLANYARYLRSLVDLSGIRPLKVVVDAGNGMGGLTVPAVLGTAAGLPELPLEIIPLYFELDGSFPNHEANPLDPKNLVDLQAAVVAHGADLGLAFDGDADRCFVVDENGEPVTGSVITLLVGLRELDRELSNGATEPTVIHNLITSQAVPELLQKHGAKTVRTRVGHSFIKAQMAQSNAVFGGEHSGHFYFRDFWFADSGMLTAMHVLAALGSGQGLPLSAVTSWYQPYSQSGEINSRVKDVAATRDSVIATYREAYPKGEVDDLDGVTFSHWQQSPRWWFNLRGSNTEPLLRLNVEAEDEDIMEKVRDDVLSLIKAEGGEPA
jgi:phosphomannomutase